MTTETSTDLPSAQPVAAIRHWQSMSVRDADAFTTWLTALGFREHATYRDDTDPSVVVHAEWVWDGGGIMFGSARGEDDVHRPGSSGCYLVVPDPDAVVAAAVAAGGRVVREVVENDYGGRGGTVADPEGNTWSIGSYQPS